MSDFRSFDDAFTPSLRTLGDDDALREFLQSTADLHRLTVAIDEPDGESFVLAGEHSTPNPAAPTAWVGEPIVYDGVNIGLLRVGHGPERSESEVERILAHVRLVLDLLLHHGHRSAVAAALQEATMREHVRQVTMQNEELRAAYEHVRQLDRLKLDFLGTVSHELRTPLTSILGYGEMLMQGVAGELQDEQREFVQTIREKG